MIPVNLSLMQVIREHYETFTPVEQIIANYFLNPGKITDFSSKAVSSALFVSEASLSRFAKKCGYSGYREFIYSYRNSVTHSHSHIDSGLTAQITDTWQRLLNRARELLDETQLQRVARLISEKKRIYLYGYGSSGIAASEIKTRLMRIGILAETGTDPDQMRIYSALVDETCLILALSISGETTDVLQSARLAKRHHASVILLTAASPEPFLSWCDEVVPVASTANLNSGTLISPQFPLLFVMDILYAYCLYSDYEKRSLVHASTLTALYDA